MQVGRRSCGVASQPVEVARAAAFLGAVAAALFVLDTAQLRLKQVVVSVGGCSGGWIGSAGGPAGRVRGGHPRRGA